MEQSVATDSEADWKLLARINYLASQKSQTAELVRKETEAAKSTLRTLVNEHGDTAQKVGDVVKQLNILTQPVVQDVCEELTILRLATFAEKLLAANLSHQVVEEQLLKRLAWLETSASDESKQPNSKELKSVCKMCQLDLRYQKLQYLKDVIEHRPDIFAKAPAAEPDEIDSSDENDEESLDMIARLLARKNKVLSTEASNLTCFLTETLRNATVPIKLPVKVLSQEQLALITRSSSEIIGSAIQTLNENFVAWVKKQLAPVLLGLCRFYYNQATARAKQRMKSEEVQTMENKAVMSTRAFELRIDALNKQLATKRLETDELLEQTVRLRMNFERNKAQLQANLGQANARIAELTAQLEEKGGGIEKLESLLSESNQKLKEAAASISQLKLQQQKRKGIVANRQARGSKGTNRIESLRTTTQTFNRPMEQIQEEADVPPQVEIERQPSSSSNRSSSSEQLASKNSPAVPRPSITTLKRESIQKRHSSVGIEFERQNQKRLVSNEDLLIKHVPLNQNSHVVEEVSQAKNALSRGTVKRIPEQRMPSNGAILTEPTHSHVGRSSLDATTEQIAKMVLTTNALNLTQTTNIQFVQPSEEVKTQGGNSEEPPKRLGNLNNLQVDSLVTAPSSLHKIASPPEGNKNIPITQADSSPKSLTRQQNMLSRTKVEKRSFKEQATTKRRYPATQQSNNRNVSISGLIQSRKGTISRNANTGENTPLNSNEEQEESDDCDEIQVEISDKENVSGRKNPPTVNFIEDNVQKVKHRKANPERKNLFNRSATNLTFSAKMLPEFGRSGFNFVPHAKRAHLQTRAADKQPQVLKQISHDEFGVDDLQLFFGVAEAYRFEASSNKRRVVAEPSADEEWLREFYAYFDRQRRTNNKLYINLKSFISAPYQTAVTRLYNSVDQSILSYAEFSELMRRILALHRKCEQVDWKRKLCGHLCSFLGRVGFDIVQAVAVKPLLPSLDH